MSTNTIASAARGGGSGWGPAWAQTARSILSHEPAVLITIAATKGSAPRNPGTRMLVTRDRIIGTIGGGHLEFKAADIARRQLAGDDVEPLQRFSLGAALGQCCGGAVELLFEPLTARAAWLDALADALQRAPATPRVLVTPVRGDARASKLIVDAASTHGTLGDAALDAAAGTAARALLTGQDTARLQPVRAGDRESMCLFDPLWPCDWRLVLFGAGHVGQALVRALADLPCHVTWVETRDAIFPPHVPDNVTVVATDAPEAEVDAAPPGAWFAVMTHSHALDQALTERILARGEFAWFGLIGSATKRRSFEQRLGARGFTREQLARVTCPIGIDGIDDKRPAAIAIAVAAQLLQSYEAIRAGTVSERDRDLGRRTC